MKRLGGLLLAVLLAGCSTTQLSTLGYYWQSVNGHLQLLQATRPVNDWLADPATPAALQQKLQLAQQIRQFASDTLALPDNSSYRRYADLGRSAAVWNVVAAPAHSLQLKTWCFLAVGCVGYRGYYAEPSARELAGELQAQGWDSSVYGVPAYSTLGWLNWLGGDPLLNTFIQQPAGELARLMFHELAHQVLFVPGDTLFNESFASAVERIGGALWLEQAPAEMRQAYARFDGRRQQLRALARSTRHELEQWYQTQASTSPEQLEQGKQRILADFRARYARLRNSWTGLPPEALRHTDEWVARANNATFAIQAAYDELVPGFERLFQQHRHWPAFYDAARALAALPTEQRHQQLRHLADAAAAEFSTPKETPRG